ncbi:hypothetical protein [Calothrix sp. 336/3]|uniref:hypothetical protein n=2 Tax=Calothrix sp. 336/3 TaxID=1337936 RepID=UPI001439C101|nr:hypothetical protein [Calothrix sp. 336/3]
MMGMLLVTKLMVNPSESQLWCQQRLTNFRLEHNNYLTLIAPNHHREWQLQQAENKRVAKWFVSITQNMEKRPDCQTPMQ